MVFFRSSWRNNTWHCVLRARVCVININRKRIILLLLYSTFTSYVHVSFLALRAPISSIVVILGLLYHPILLLFLWSYYKITYADPKGPPMQVSGGFSSIYVYPALKIILTLSSLVYVLLREVDLFVNTSTWQVNSIMMGVYIVNSVILVTEMH